ncbi:MAG TPA: hypothetical protein PKJ45_11425 [Rubrivivax sp.]|nr:hypothetical protein [Burkholderiales bacterium]HNU11953.1 hypothetical protein [Rubrivivax sp.]
MRSLSLLPARRRHSTLSTPSAFRVEVRPPSLRHAPASLGQRLLFWLMAPAPQDAAPPINRLPAVKRDFLASLDDVALSGAEPLRATIDAARSLRELWHLRTALYGVIGRAHSEHVAEQRLERLNRHFPTKTPRAGATAVAAHAGPGAGPLALIPTPPLPR